MKTVKKIVLTALSIAFIHTTAKAQTDKKGLARVNKIQGVEAYIMCEPLRDYDVVLDVTTGLKATSIVTGGLVNESVSDKATQFVKRSINKCKEENKQFDAIVYASGKRVIAVKFKDTPTLETKGVGRVKKINGAEIYVLNEPLADYEVVNDKSGGIKVKSIVTAGVVNNSIEEDVEQFVKRLLNDAEKDKKKIDAVIYSAGKSAIGVKFK